LFVKVLYNRDSTIQKCFRKSTLCVSQKNWFPVSRSDDRAIPSERSSVHCSIHPDDVDFHPDHSLHREASVPICIRSDVSAAHPDASQYSTKLQILSKFSYGKIDIIDRTTWIPARTRFSLRQESQFKFNRPDASLPSSGRACI
jgi:hypothetical protein